MEEEKKEAEQYHKKMNITSKVRENPWILSTLVCGILSVVLIVSIFSGGFTGNVISAKSAGEKILNFYQDMGIQGLALGSVSEVSGLYEVDLKYKNQTIPIYVTKDGKSFTESLTPTGDAVSDSSSTTQKDIPKSDKPIVELYVFSYCPYGTQMEKAMIPVVKLLGDKIDFQIRQIGAMHGDFEKVEAQRQLCIEKNYPTKLLDYILAFDSDSTCSTGDTACVATKTSSIFTKLGIDVSKINSCMTSEGITLYDAEVSNAQSKGVSGSPTLIINGVEAQASRSPEGVKGAICTAFNNVPSECSTTLDTNQASAGFGSSTSSSSSTTSTC
jgi:hypothetical protein